MTDSKHSPTPWRFNPDRGEILSDAAPAGANRPDVIEEYGGFPVAETVLPSNGARIVQCANAFEDGEDPAKLRDLVVAVSNCLSDQLIFSGITTKKVASLESAFRTFIGMERS